MAASNRTQSVFSSFIRLSPNYALSRENLTLSYGFVNCSFLSIPNGGWLLQSSPVETFVRCYGDRDVTWSSQGMLRLSPRAMTRLFQPTLDHIKQLIGDILNEPSLKGNPTIQFSLYK